MKTNATTGARQSVRTIQTAVPAKRGEAPASAAQPDDASFAWSSAGDRRTPPQQARDRRLLGQTDTRSQTLPSGIQASVSLPTTRTGRQHTHASSTKVQEKARIVIVQIEDHGLGRADLLEPQGELSATELRALTALLQARYGDRIQARWSDVRSISGTTYGNLQYRLVDTAPRSGE